MVLTPDQRSEIVAEFASGIDPDDTAAKYGIRRQHVYRLAMQRGIRRSRLRVPVEEHPKVAERYEAGETLMDIGRTYGCDGSVVRRALISYGVKIRPTGHRPRDFSDEQKREITELWDAGVTQADIVRQLRLGQAKVSKFLLSTGRRRERGGNYRGGRVISTGGYVSVAMAWDHPFADIMRNSMGYVLEHRLVVAENLGRALRSNETVHHVNGNKQDNRLENLQLRSGRHGTGIVLECASCGSRDITPVPLR